MEEAGDEPLFCERAAGIDIGKQVVMRHDPGAQRHPPGRPAAGDAGVRHHPPPAAGAGGLAALLAGASGPGWRPPATTCEVRVHEFKWEAPLEARLRPVV